MRRTRWFGLLVVGSFLLGACASLQSGVPEVAVAEVAVASASEDGQVRLMAGQHLEVGVVTVTNDAEEVCVTYALNEGALADGWLLYETHLFVGADDDFPLTRANARLGGPYNANPIPGQFPFGDDDLAGVEEWRHCVGLDDLGIELGDEVFVAAHAVIGGVGLEAAWGEGARFSERGNWGAWFTYTLAFDLNVTVGPEGGLVVGADGIAVGVLPGILTTDVSIEIIAIDPADPAFDVPPVPPGELEPVGGVYAIRASRDVSAPPDAPFLLAMTLPGPLPDPASLGLALLIEPDQVVLDSSGDDTPERFWLPVDGQYDDDLKVLFVRFPELRFDFSIFRLVHRRQIKRSDPPEVPVTDARYTVNCVGFQAGSAAEEDCLAQASDYAALLAGAHMELRSFGYERPALLYDALFQVVSIDPTGLIWGYELISEVYQLDLRRPGTGHCARARGYYIPSRQTMTVCFVAAGWAQRSLTALHEMFHGFQYAYLKDDACTNTNLWFLEGTPDVAGSTAHTGVPSKRPYPDRDLRRVTTPFYENAGLPPYRLQDFFLYLLVTQNQDLHLFRHILEGIAAAVEASPAGPCPIRPVANQVIADRTTVSMGELYWRWVKYQAFERDVDLGDDVHASGPCSNATIRGRALAEPTHIVAPASGSAYVSAYLPARTARWFEIDFSAAAGVLDAGLAPAASYYDDIRFTVHSHGAAGVNVKYYRDNDIPGWTNCTVATYETTNLQMNQSFTLYGDAYDFPDRPVYILVANTHDDWAMVSVEVVYSP